MKVLLLSDGTFVAQHTARRLIELGHVVLDVRGPDFAIGSEGAGSAMSAEAMMDQAESFGCDRVLCIAGAHSTSTGGGDPVFTKVVDRATEIAKARGARFVLATAAPRATAARGAMWEFEQRVARAAWHLGLDAGVCRLEGVYGGHATGSEKHPVLGPLVSAAISSAALQIVAPWDGLHWPLHVRDAVDGVVRMLATDGSNQVRLAGATAYRTRDLVATVEAIVGSRLRYTMDRLDERRSTHPPHISAARQLLRWRPRVGLYAGIEEQAFNDAIADANLGP